MRRAQKPTGLCERQFGRVHTLTYVAASVHLLEAVQVGFESSQVLLLHVAKQVLDGQRGHLDGRGGVHVCVRSVHPLLTSGSGGAELVCCYLFAPRGLTEPLTDLNMPSPRQHH